MWTKKALYPTVCPREPIEEIAAIGLDRLQIENLITAGWSGDKNDNRDNIPRLKTLRQYTS